MAIPPCAHNIQNRHIPAEASQIPQTAQLWPAKYTHYTRAYLTKKTLVYYKGLSYIKRTVYYKGLSYVPRNFFNVYTADPYTMRAFLMYRT